MIVTVGIDMGGTNTKIAFIENSTSKYLSGILLDASSQDISKAIELEANNCSYEICQIALTGVGSFRIEDKLCGKEPFRSNEFTAIGLGGLLASGLDEAIVASMGTGTAFIHAKKNEFRHIIGSGVGGGTISGLSKAVAGTKDFYEIENLAKGGDLGKVDLTMGEMTKGTLPSLDPNLTASNFANISPDASANDLTCGIINLVLQTIGTMSILAAKTAGIKDIVITGALSKSYFSERTYTTFSEFYGYNFVIAENPIYSTALGAAVDCLNATV